MMKTGSTKNGIRMSKPKHVGESVFVNDVGEGMVVVGAPDVVYNPLTQQKEKILAVITTPITTNCPNCKEQNDPGIEITMLESCICVYACKRCNQYVWYKKRNNCKK